MEHVYPSHDISVRPLVLREFLKISVQFIKAGVNSKFYSIASGMDALLFESGISEGECSAPKCL